MSDGYAAAMDRVPGKPIQALRASDHRHDQQVHGYLTEERVRAAVQARVAAAVEEDSQVLVGHSLGYAVTSEAARARAMADRAADSRLSAGDPQHCVRQARACPPLERRGP